MTDKKSQPDDERRAATDLSPAEKQKVAEAAAEGEALEPGPDGDLTPPDDNVHTGEGGLSDSQHASSEDPT